MAAKAAADNPRDAGSDTPHTPLRNQPANI